MDPHSQDTTDAQGCDALVEPLISAVSVTFQEWAATEMTMQTFHRRVPSPPGDYGDD